MPSSRVPSWLPASTALVAVVVLVGGVAAAVLHGSGGSGPAVVVDRAGGFQATFPHGAHQRVVRSTTDGYSATEYEAVDDGHGYVAEVITYSPALPTGPDVEEGEVTGALTAIGDGTHGVVLTTSADSSFHGDTAKVATYTSDRYGPLTGFAAVDGGRVVVLLAPQSGYEAFRDSFSLAG